MFTRSTLTIIVAAGMLTGCATPSSGTASISSVDESSPANTQASSDYVNTTYIADADNSTAVQANTAADTATAVTQTAAVDAAGSPAQNTTAATSTATVPVDSTPPTDPATATADAGATDTSSIKTPIIPAVTTAPQMQTESANQPAAQAEIHVYHELTRTDDGSSIIVTLDGKEAGVLKRGEVTSLSVTPGKHKLGGYVKTLFGMGRVTIPALDITTSTKAVTKISYAVTKDKPGFTLTKKGNS